MISTNTRREWLDSAIECLSAHEIEAPALVAQLLLGEVLGLARPALIAHDDEPLSAAEDTAVEAMLARRLADEPLSYILGRAEFFGLTFEVSPAVLIPRGETEHVVETVLRRAAPLNRDTHWTAIEIGVGSGCLSIALLVHAAGMRIHGVDVSGAAVAVARRNAERHGVAARLVLVEGDGFAPLPESVRGLADCVVSNPPYVGRHEAGDLRAESLKYEPSVALFAGDGGEFHSRLLRESPAWLRPGGWLVMELGADQAPALRAEMAREHGDVFTDIETVRDYRGHERVLAARRRG